MLRVQFNGFNVYANTIDMAENRITFKVKNKTTIWFKIIMFTKSKTIAKLFRKLPMVKMKINNDPWQSIYVNVDFTEL